MGRDWIPAIVANEASEGVRLVVLDGDLEAQPTRSDFRSLNPGEPSTKYFRSVDAFGAYCDGCPVEVSFCGVASSWWRISDGTHCRVLPNPAGFVLTVDQQLPHMPLPRPSSAAFWGYREDNDEAPRLADLLDDSPEGS